MSNLPPKGSILTKSPLPEDALRQLWENTNRHSNGSLEKNIKLCHTDIQMSKKILLRKAHLRLLLR